MLVGQYLGPLKKVFRVNPRSIIPSTKPNSMDNAGTITFSSFFYFYLRLLIDSVSLVSCSLLLLLSLMYGPVDTPLAIGVVGLYIYGLCKS